MGSGFSTTFKKIYCSNPPALKIEKILKSVFQNQLGQLYKVAKLERINLLEYYGFTSKAGTHVQKQIDALYGKSMQDKILTLPTGKRFPNPAYFYTADLRDLFGIAVDSCYFSFVHGDLNGANIVIDSQENIWLIDFFHTHKGHVLKDLIKLENDLLYIFTPLENKDHLEEAVKLTDLLLDIKDLANPLPEVKETGLSFKQLKRAFKTVKLLRSFYPPLIKHDRSPLQLLTGQLRYAVHTLSFDESNDWQKFWALYTAGRISSLLKKNLQARGPLRIDWLDNKYSKPGRLGITILPGRRDFDRSLREDMASLKKQGVTHVVTLVTPDELTDYGVANLNEVLKNSGFETRYLGIKDQGVSSLEQMAVLVQWIQDTTAKGKKVMMHCVGGLGRSGLVAASYLVAQGIDAKTAVAEVRRVRSSRAIESREQEEFIFKFESYIRFAAVSSGESQ
jgi:protein-tyrosine phosphatase